MTSPPEAPAPAPAQEMVSTTKRKRDDDDEGDSQQLQQTHQHLQISPPPRPILPRTTTIALHTAPPRPTTSSPPTSSTPRFSFIAPRPAAASRNEIDGTPPYPPFVQTSGLAFTPFVAGATLEAQDGGANSPRTHVANRFNSLAIAPAGRTEPGAEGEGSFPSEPAAGDATDDAEIKLPLHKRMKRDDQEMTETATTEPSSSPDRIITDPLRASLTWQDDEITVYDPNDADDDGTGVNGIGFKPTPAMAHARALKRRQQLAAYRKREEREARARRSLQRTRGNQAARAARQEGSGTEGTGSDGPSSLSATELSSSQSQSEPSSSQPDAFGIVDPRTPRSLANAAAAAALSSPPATASPSVRRVRFLETGPVTIRFKEPDAVPSPSPTSIMSS
ncbi:hypothetical protein Sste5344_001625 [Sporothrix stenoceras]